MKKFRLISLIPSIIPIFLFIISAHAVFSATLNDPLVDQWSYRDVGLFRAWDDTRGSKKVVVAVIDNGFDTFHPDLRDNAWKNQDETPDNGIDDDKNGYIDDVWGWNFVPADANGDGVISGQEQKGNNDPRPNPEGLTENQKKEGAFHHGTIVAGIIGAVGDNGTDGSGASPNVRLMNVRVADGAGEGNDVLLDDAILYAVDNGADIINISLVGSANPDVPKAIDTAYAKGVAVFVAAGNQMVDLNASPMSPICADNDKAEEHVIGVSAINEAHQIASFSNVGSDCIDITAPGVNMSSTLRFSPLNGLTSRYGGPWKGTSFSAPLVSGAAVLVKSVQPTWKAKEIYHALIATVHKTPGQDETEYANLFGAGLLQADKAVAYAKEQLPIQPTAIPVLSPSETDEGEFLTLVSRTAGMSETYDIKTSTQSETVVVSFTEPIDDLDVYEDKNGEALYVTAARFSAGHRIITRYTKDWKKKDRILVPATGPIDMLVAPLANGGADAVAIAPRYAATLVFAVYNLETGVRISSYQQSMPHTGVSLGQARDSGSLQADILALYKEKKATILSRFSADGKKKGESIAIAGANANRSIIGADIDGDGIQEYAIGGSFGDPFLAYYEPDGALKRKFFVFSGSVGGFSLAADDYDEDGKDDIIVIPKISAQPIRIWNYKSKKLAEWQAFAEKAVIDMIGAVQL